MAVDLYAVIRESPLQQSDEEFRKLLKKADGQYKDFSAIFGEPDASRSIFDSPAFRWGVYQMLRRVERDGWLQVWRKSWGPTGWISEYRDLHESLKPLLDSWGSTLAKEEGRLAFSPFPLKANPELQAAFNHARWIFDALSGDCSLEQMEIYKDSQYASDACYMIVYVLAVMELIGQRMNSLYLLHMPSQST